jgi:hypothetical protein
VGRAGESSRREGLPTPGDLDADIREVIAALRELRHAYTETYRDGLSAPSGSSIPAIGTATNDSSPTESAWASPMRRRQRAACKASISMLRRALDDVEAAKAVLGGGEMQPTRVPRWGALITQGQFDRALHRRREEALRS